MMTREQELTIRGMIQRNEIINLVKEYRAITGFGLKDSKDAIYKICPDWNCIHLHEEEYVALFNGYIEAVEKAIRERQEAEKAALIAMRNKQHEDNKARLLRGVSCVYNSWSDLGYENPREALNDLNERLEGKGWLRP